MKDPHEIECLKGTCANNRDKLCICEMVYCPARIQSKTERIFIEERSESIYSEKSRNRRW